MNPGTHRIREVIVLQGLVAYAAGTVGFVCADSLYQTTGSADAYANAWGLALVLVGLLIPGFGYWLDRRDAREALCFSTALAAGSLLLLSGANLSPWIATTSLSLVAVAHGIQLVAMVPIVTRTLSGGDVWKANAALILVAVSPRFLGPLFMGPAVETGWDTELIFLLLILLLISAFRTIRAGALPARDARPGAEERTSAKTVPAARWILGALLLVLLGRRFATQAVEILIFPLVDTPGASGNMGLILGAGALGSLAGAFVIAKWPPKNAHRAAGGFCLITAAAMLTLVSSFEV